MARCGASDQGIWRLALRLRRRAPKQRLCPCPEHSLDRRCRRHVVDGLCQTGGAGGPGWGLLSKWRLSPPGSGPHNGRVIRLRKLVRAGLALALGGLVALAALEVALRSTARPVPFHLRAPRLRQLLNTDPSIMPGIEGPGLFSTNSVGLRGPEWGERGAQARVLCLGGSTTECLYLDDSETWPSLAAAQLRSTTPPRDVWVGAAGVTGYSALHHLAFARESELVREVDCVVVMLGVNDLWQDLLVKSDEERLAMGAPRGVQQVRVVAWAHAQYDRLRASMGGLEHWAYPMPSLRAERVAATKRDDAPPMDAALERFADRVEAIATVLRERGVRPIFVTQPVRWAAGQSPELEASYWFGWLPDGAYLSTASLRELMERYNARTRERCAALGVPCVDLDELNGGSEWFFDDCHFTEAGAREVARRVAVALSDVVGDALKPSDVDAGSRPQTR